MTIEDLWNKLLTLDLIPIFEVLAMSFISAMVIIAVALGGIVWWLHRREQ
jgi:hypothetical protein